jgi:hypothetical protein
VPKSKSKRRRYQPPPKPKPKPSPAWVGALFFTLLALGFLVILARFMLPGIVPWLDNQWALAAGLALIAVAFVVSTHWH